jgi:hypothetical protein
LKPLPKLYSGRYLAALQAFLMMVAIGTGWNAVGYRGVAGTYPSSTQKVNPCRWRAIV